MSFYPDLREWVKKPRPAFPIELRSSIEKAGRPEIF
jgi:hypothetical protein